jgi:hypothetical protein
MLAVSVTGRAAGYPDRPPVAHTGGFGEPTCHACHAGAPPNKLPGRVTLDGVPDRYVPGHPYRLTVVLTRPGMAAGGFQLAARFAAGAAAGRQAGDLGPVDDRVAVTIADSTGIAYAQHTLAGVRPPVSDTARWTLEWRAPVSKVAVVFHVAANAADDDASPFGDFVHTVERRVAGSR